MKVAVRDTLLEVHPLPDYLTRVVTATQDYFEADILDYLWIRYAPRLRQGTIVDVGAMVGNHTVYFARHFPQASIRSFEPHPSNLALLRENVARYGNVHVYPTALGANDHEVRRMAAPDPDNMGHVVLGDDGLVTVYTRSLDIYGFLDVRLIKVDVEGMEPEVLHGAKQTIELYHPFLLVESWSGEPTWPGYEVVADWPSQQTYLLG